MGDVGGDGEAGGRAKARRPVTRARAHFGDPGMRPLSVREQLFVDEYLLDLNSQQAAKRAGYQWHGGAAYRLLRRPNVVAAIQKAMDARAARVGVSVDKVLAEISALAFARFSDFASWGVRDGKAWVAFTPSDELDPKVLAIVAEARVVQGGMRVKMHDKVAALILLARHLGLLRDRVEVSGPEGAPVMIDGVSEAAVEAARTAVAEAAATGTQVVVTTAQGALDYGVEWWKDVPREIRERLRGMLLEAQAARDVALGKGREPGDFG